MHFDVSARSTDMREPVHTFPGDEKVSKKDYKQTIFGGYISSVSTLYGVAKSFGLDIDTETFERWKRVWSSMGRIDNYLDGSDLLDHSRLYFQYLEPVAYGEMPLIKNADPLLLSSLQLLRNSVQPLPPETIERLVSNAREIGTIAVLKANCEDLHDYINMVRNEGSLSASLAARTVTESIRTQETYPMFVTWCKSGLEAATLLDHGHDLWKDYKNGLTQVTPSVKSSLALAKAAMEPLGVIMETDEMKAATLQALCSRATFSLLPTKLALAVHKHNK